MLPINQMLTTINRTPKKGKKNVYLVIHWVGAVSTAYNNAKYFKNKYRGASAHYFVDEQSIYQVVKDSDAAWHCGAKKYYHNKCRNSNSISIEMCLSSKGTVGEKTIRNTADLVQFLMKKYKIPGENVLRHYDVTHKLCPAVFVDEKKWKSLKKRLIGQDKKTKQYVKVISIGNDGKGLAVRKKPDWNAEPIMYLRRVGDVFTVVKKVKVGSRYMYLLKSGLYITASNQYVKYYTKVKG